MLERKLLSRPVLGGSNLVGEKGYYIQGCYIRTAYLQKTQLNVSEILAFLNGALFRLKLEKIHRKKPSNFSVGVE